MKVRKQVTSNLAKKLLATHSTDCIIILIIYYLCLFIQTKFQWGIYNQVYTNETYMYSVANLQNLIPSLAGIIISKTNQIK